MSYLSKLVISILLMMLSYKVFIEVKFFLLNLKEDLGIVLTKVKIRHLQRTKTKAEKNLKKLKEELTLWNLENFTGRCFLN